MGTLFRKTPNNGYPFPPQWPLKMGIYGFGGVSRAPPSKQHLSTPPPPPPGHLASAPRSRNLQGTIYDIYVGVTYIPISVLHHDAGYILKTEELTRFLSHIHQENYKLLVFCEKNPDRIPLFILISERARPNDISNIIYFSFWWHC